LFTAPKAHTDGSDESQLRLSRTLPASGAWLSYMGRSRVAVAQVAALADDIGDDEVADRLVARLLSIHHGQSHP